MAKLRCTRRLQPVGGSCYVPIPRRALLELRLLVGDWLEWELDTDERTLTLRPVKFREQLPITRARWNDMAEEKPSESAPAREIDARQLPPVLLEIER